MIKLLEYAFDNTIDANCLPAFSGVGTTEVVDEVSGNITKRIINVEENGLPTRINFNGKKALLTLEYANTSNVTAMSLMFNNCLSLTSINTSIFDTSKTKDMSYMFGGCSSLTSLDLSHFSTSNVTNMNYMFGGCSSLTSLDLTSFNTSNVTNMNYMFGGCSSLTSLDLTSFNTSNVKNLSAIFIRCSSLTSLDLSHFSTSNVTNMQSMFENCSKLKKLDLSHFNTGKVTSMSFMVKGCSMLSDIDLSNFKFIEGVNTTQMFNNSNNLKNIGLLYSPSSTINTIATLLPTTISKNIYYQDTKVSELAPVNNVNFVEYKTNTLTTPSDLVLRSNGSIHDELDLITGKLTRRIGEDNEVLAREIVKTVTISIVDQDGNKIGKLSAFNDITHIISGSDEQDSPVGEVTVEVPTKSIKLLHVAEVLAKKK